MTEPPSHLIVDLSHGAVERERRIPFTPEDIAQRAVDAVESVGLAWAALRAHRNGLLAQADWTQLPDAPLTASQRGAWAAYRQALRRLPSETENPAAPLWPTQPKSVGA